MELSNHQGFTIKCVSLVLSLIALFHSMNQKETQQAWLKSDQGQEMFLKVTLELQQSSMTQQYA